MFGRLFKSKDDSSKSQPPPGHRTGEAANASEPPVGGGFFNLQPPPVAKGPTSYAAPPSVTQPGGGGASGAGNASSFHGRPSTGNHSVPSYGQPPQPPSYGQPQPPSYGNSHSAASPAPSGGGMDMFGGMSIKAPGGSSTVGGAFGGGPQPPRASPVKYGYGGADAPTLASAAPITGGSLFSGLEVAPSGPAPLAPSFGHDDQPPLASVERKKSSSSARGSFNYLDVAATSTSMDVQSVQRQSIGPGSTITRPGVNKTVKKKKTKSFRPGFGRQLSDESIAALQRGDLNEEDIIQQSQQAAEEQEKPSAPPRMATNPTDLAHLLPPVKGGSVLAGLTVHEGGSTNGSSVLAGLTVHSTATSSPRSSTRASSTSQSSDSGILAGLSVHSTKASSNADADASTSVVLPSSHESPARPKKKTSQPEPEKPAAPLTPEERLMNTLRDFHESAVSFRNSTLKQNEEENRIMEKKVQLAKQLTQYEIDLRTIEAQQQQAVDVEDFEKADALNATINSVRHRITLSESDVRKVDAELAAFVKAKEKAFANQLRSTRGTLKELEKFREDQETERTALRNELKKYEAEQTEHLQFEAERIDTELSHVSSNMDHLRSEKTEIEETIEEQCKTEIHLREDLLVERAGVEEEIRELERQLKLKMEQLQGIQASIDKAEKDIDVVRSKYSRQLKRIADREEGLLKTKSEVEADAELLKEERRQFSDTIQDYEARIAAFGKRMTAVKKEMRAAMLLATVLEVQETRREQAIVRKKQHTAELTALADSAAIAEQSFIMLRKQHDDLEKSLSVHHNAIASAQAMIPKLEQEKKAAAAQRNFKEAARISKDIKALEKDQGTAEEMVEVVEMELQDLTERIDKRGAEFEEKKEELKTVEKQLELNTLQELWKESKHLRKALRKFEKLKSESVAAADGIDFRASAILLVQAEYDACVLQTEALEKKYDVMDPSHEDEEEDDDDIDADDSVDEDEVDRLAEVGASSSHANMSAVHGADFGDIDATVIDGPGALEEISAKIAELEEMIEKATEAEEYELAAKLDEKLEMLRQRQQSLEVLGTTEAPVVAIVEASVSVEGVSSNSSELAVSDNKQADVGDEGNSVEELEEELRMMRVRIKMLEADIERATENEDYEAAAGLDEELQQLRDEESEIVQLLEESSIKENDEVRRSATETSVGGMFGGLELKTSNESGSAIAVNETGRIFAGLHVTSAAPEELKHEVDSEERDEEDVEEDEEDGGEQIPSEEPSMFAGLQVSSSELTIEAEAESSTISLQADSGMFAGLHVTSTGAEEDTREEVMDEQNGSTTEVVGSVNLLAGLEVTEMTEASVERDEITHGNESANGTAMAASPSNVASAISPKEVVSSPRRCSVGSRPNSPHRKSSVGMFAGLEVGSPAVDPLESPRKVSIGSPSSDEHNAVLFDGLQLGTSTEASTTMFDGLETGTNSVPTIDTTESASMFGGLSIVSNEMVKEDATDDDEDGVIVEAEDEKAHPNPSESSVFSGLTLKTSEVSEEVVQEAEVKVTNVTQTEASVSITTTTTTTTTTSSESTTTVVGTSDNLFGGLSLAPVASSTTEETTKE